ncbi:hypothetical protein QYF61_015579 [Mycteria americana]|uniref:PHD finger protein 7 n=1 Tax=Mycteria americana TaxID=33587 RepID=A0AAN7N006_MYCAM|nr:hypothetical protein QYF61_015579 [Mycteria americana]
MREPRPGSKVASVPCIGEPRTGGSTAEAALPVRAQRGRITFPELLAALPVPGAGAEISLGQGWSPGVALPEQRLSAKSATSTAAPGGLPLDSALAAGAAAPVTRVPRARAPASALHTHPCEAVAVSEWVAGGRGRPCPYLARTQASGADVTAATVTRAGARPQKGTLGSGRASGRPGEVRRGQGMDGACAGLPREEGGPTPRGSGPVLQAHPRLASPSPAPCFSLRVSRGAFGGDTPALLGQGLSKRSPLTCAMSARKRQAPDSMEQGESKVSLPRPGRGRVGVVSVGPRAVAGGGRSSPTAPGQGPSFPQQAGPRLGTGHLLGRPCLQCPLPLQGLQPCPSASWAGTEQALGGNPSGTRPPAPQRCSFPLPFALSPPACMLCRRAEADPDIYGEKLEKQGICAHVFCLFFANKLFQQPVKEIGLMGFLPEDIRRTIARAAQKHCFVCGESGATITCWETGCDRSFHLPCAVEGGCVSQFLPQYRSFCWEHRPEQAVEAAPEENTTCLICLELVGDRKSYSTMVCPACKHAWFHRGCIQGQAVRAGISCFQCPLCRDKNLFLLEMLVMGIRIPFRRPSWENSHTYAGLSERHSRCDASECLCPGGREHAEEEGPWQLLLCCSCAAEGTHRRCSYSRNSTARWECDGCAGLGTGKRQSIRVPLGSGCPGWAWQSLSAPGGLGPPLWPILPQGLGGRALDPPASVTASSASSELAGPSTASQSGSGPSRGSPAPETSSPSPSSHAASGQSLASPAPETSSPSTGSQAASGQSVVSLAPETSSPSAASQSGSGPSRGSPTPETTSPSTSSHAASGQPLASPAPETSSPSSGSQAASGLSHSSPAPETSSPSAVSPSGSGPSHGSPTPETSSPSTGSQAALGPSRGSPVLEGSSCSSPSGPDCMRNRSRLNRRAQTPYSRPSRRRDSSHAPAPSAESSTPSQAALGLSHGCPVPETSSPSTASQLPSGSSYGSPALQGSLRSSPPGPERVRDRSRLQRRAQTPYSRPSSRRESSRAPAPSAESSTPSQAALGPSHGSPVPETSSLSTASQLPSGSSCGSPALESGRRSSSPGPVRMRDRSRLQRRAQTPYSRPGGRRGTSRAPSPSAGPDPPPPAQ